MKNRFMFKKSRFAILLPSIVVMIAWVVGIYYYQSFKEEQKASYEKAKMAIKTAEQDYLIPSLREPVSKRIIFLQQAAVSLHDAEQLLKVKVSSREGAPLTELAAQLDKHSSQIEQLLDLTLVKQHYEDAEIQAVVDSLSNMNHLLPDQYDKGKIKTGLQQIQLLSQMTRAAGSDIKLMEKETLSLQG
jgi:hypothetical protein